MAQVGLVVHHGHRQIAGQLLIFQADPVGAVLAGVVTDENL